MSAQIGAPEIAAVVGWLDGRCGSAGDFERWCEARSIDPEALSAYGDKAVRNCFAAIATGELAPAEAFAAVAILGVQVGADVERRRRDGAELPAPGRS
jgi:hypothetical protein